MNNNFNMSFWKKALKWVSLALVSCVVLDWLLDGRLRERLPFRRQGKQSPTQ
ncbi:MAG: hypothetical protein WCK27_26900 [Verrucomicrobiota bacterium]